MSLFYKFCLVLNGSEGCPTMHTKQANYYSIYNKATKKPLDFSWGYLFIIGFFLGVWEAGDPFLQ